MTPPTAPVSVDPRSNAARRRQARLTAELRSAHLRLVSWEDSIRAGLSAVPPVAGTDSAEARALLETLATASRAIERRLQELDGSSVTTSGTATPPVAAVPSRRRRDPATWLHRLCLRACRACGRSIAAAFRRARSAADMATAGVLYQAMRAFEKQIWLLDPHHGRA